MNKHVKEYVEKHKLISERENEIEKELIDNFNKINQLQENIDKLKKDRQQLCLSPIDDIVMGLAGEIAKELKCIHFLSDKNALLHQIHGPFGASANRIYVYFFNNEDLPISYQDHFELKLILTDPKNGIIEYETGETEWDEETECRKNILKELPNDIKDIIALLKRNTLHKTI